MKAAFLDRDGVINQEVGYLHEISKFKYVDGTKLALKNLRKLGYEIVVITNQSGIGRGFYTEEQYRTLTNYLINDLRSSGISVLDIFYCPHFLGSDFERYRGPCSCRKPAPGMITKAVRKFGIDPKDSILVGDKLTDIEAGRAAGIATCFLVESGHALPLDISTDVPVLENLLAVTNVLAELDLNEAL
jgi:D-glycero-D-manno-heptose 1,7-bisphosphate phosphatase